MLELGATGATRSDRWMDERDKEMSATFPGVPTLLVKPSLLSWNSDACTFVVCSGLNGPSPPEFHRRRGGAGVSVQPPMSPRGGGGGRIERIGSSAFRGACCGVAGGGGGGGGGGSGDDDVVEVNTGVVALGGCCNTTIRRVVESLAVAPIVACAFCTFTTRCCGAAPGRGPETTTIRVLAPGVAYGPDGGEQRYPVPC